MSEDQVVSTKEEEEEDLEEEEEGRRISYFSCRHSPECNRHFFRLQTYLVRFSMGFCILVERTAQERM